jgi:hypothetical protein
MATSPKLKGLIKKSLNDPGWDLANKVLYDLCKKHPEHDDYEKVVAKIWLIGRSYAAAIERGRPKGKPSEDFYVDAVGKPISDKSIYKKLDRNVVGTIDDWIDDVKKTKLDEKSLQSLIDVHWKVTQLFSKISTKNNRSLASKYLHFHLPELFFIFDSRAQKALGSDLFAELKSKPFSDFSGGDVDYRRFAVRCLNLRENVKREHGVELTPRQLDNLLLAVDGRGTP